VASVICAWEVAREMVQKDTQLRAEARSLNIPRPTSVQERVAMRRAVEAKYGTMPTKEQPSSEYLSSKLEELEQEEVTASPLDEVTSTEEVENQSVQASLDPSGRIKLVKTKVKGKLPSTTEEFRTKHRLECNAWLMLATKFTNKGYLKDVCPTEWTRYVDYFLGEKVLNLKVPSQVDETLQPLNPPWSVVLHYEYECRKAAFKQVREKGLPMMQALLESIRDPELKEIHFTSPIALGARGRRQERQRSPTTPSKFPRSEGKGKGKRSTGSGSTARGGKGKGGAKGQAKLVDPRWAPDLFRVQHAWRLPSGRVLKGPCVQEEGLLWQP